MDWGVERKRPYILGHRGASADAPENTLAAFALAQTQGADGIEFDVQLSADGHVVVFHDLTVERLTNGSGKISEMPLAEIQTFVIAGKQQIPTLDQVFELLGPSLLYNIELKYFGFGDTGLETAVADRITSHNLESQTLVSSFNPFAVKRMRQQASKQIKVGHLWKLKRLKYKYIIAAAEAHHPHHILVNEKYVQWARKHNWMINVWTVDDPQEAQRLIDLGVDSILTNKPQFLREQLGYWEI